MNRTYWKIKMNGYIEPDALMTDTDDDFVKIFKFYEEWLFADDIWLEHQDGSREFLPECKIIEKLKEDIHSCRKLGMSEYDENGQIDGIILFTQVDESNVDEKKLSPDEFLRRYNYL